MYQKRWTIVTGCGIMAAMHDHNLECNLMGSGDNQFLGCKIPPNMGSMEILLSIMSGLQAFSDRSFLPIKLKETFVSLLYMEYGRTSYPRGKRISQALKRASRIGTESQETIPSISTELSGIFATGIVATAAECGTTASAYAVSCVEVGITLRTSGFKAPAARIASVLMLGR